MMLRHNSGLFFKLPTHSSAGGQLLQPSELNSSSRVVGFSPLSNVRVSPKTVGANRAQAKRTKKINEAVPRP
jgi:hypothetical protein